MYMYRILPYVSAAQVVCALDCTIVFRSRRKQLVQSLNPFTYGINKKGKAYITSTKNLECECTQSDTQAPLCVKAEIILWNQTCIEDVLSSSKLNLAAKDKITRAMETSQRWPVLCENVTNDEGVVGVSGWLSRQQLFEVTLMHSKAFISKLHATNRLRFWHSSQLILTWILFLGTLLR